MDAKAAVMNPAQLRAYARPAPDCMPGMHCERYARGLGGCVAGHCNPPAAESLQRGAESTDGVKGRSE